MLNYCATLTLGCLILILSVAVPNSGKSVTLKGTIHKDATRAKHFIITVQFEIGMGWHISDDDGEGSAVQTSLKLKLPEGVKAVGSWKRPMAIDDLETQSKVHVGRVRFSTSVLIEPRAYGKKIDVLVSYQACTDEFCNPPQKRTVSITIPTRDSSSSGAFAAPVRLMVKDVPLNAVSKQKRRFLSPAMFDIDGDGQKELVMGSLSGRLDVYENLSVSGKGDPIWDTGVALKSATGQPIRTSNW